VDAHALDTRQLCIRAGKFAWRLCLDIVVLDDGGNVLDIACAAAHAALANARLPLLRLFRGETEEDWDVEVDDDQNASVPVPGVSALPMLLTITQVAGHCILDALSAEEACAGSRVVVSVTRSGHIASLQCDGATGLAPADLEECIMAAATVGPALFARLDDAVAAAEASSSGSSGAAAADGEDGGRGGGASRHHAARALLSDTGAVVISKANEVALGGSAGT